MAIQKRQGKTGISWRVYWNNPYTGARQSCTFASQAEAVKHDALVKYQLQYEKERFLPVEPQKEKKPDDSLESTFYAFLKERQFSRKGLAFQLDGMKRALVMLGRKRLSAITRQDLAAVVQAEVAKGVSAKTVHTRTGCLFAVLRWAYRRGLLDTLPQFPERPSFSTPPIVPPTAEEIRRMLEAAPPHLQRVIIIGSKMGLRVGPCELLKLRWSDVDFERSLIRVRAAAKNKKEPVREVPIMASLLPAFRAWHDLDALHGCSYVISWKGKPVLSIKTAWAAMLKRAGITRNIRPYDLRHAFATDAIANGADLGTVAKLMGHASIQMVVQHYQHVATRQKRQAVESLPSVDIAPLLCAAPDVPDNRTAFLQ